MKIALINPPFLFPSRNEIVFSQCIGLRSISSCLKMNGKHEVHFVDALMHGFSKIRRYYNGYMVGSDVDGIVSLIPPETELVGISAPFSQIAPIVHQIAERVKEKLPDAKVVMGGVYPSTQPELAKASCADYIVVGEGEQAMVGISANLKPTEIRGVYSKDEKPGRGFAPAEMVKNLNMLPFPDYSLPDMERYFTLSQRMKRGRTASLVTSRGCPFSCEFCSINSVYGRKYRPRAASGVLEEIKLLVDRYSIQALEIEDDNFTLLKGRTAEILEGIVRLNEKGAGLSWSTPNGVRIDTLDESIIKLIKRSNCTSLTLALEHGDQEVLKIMNKKLNLDRAYEIMKLLVKHEIPQIGVFVIVGYPGETEARYRESLRYLKKVRGLGNSIRVIVNFAQPYPGTKLTARCREEGIIKDKDLGNFLIKRELMSTGHIVPITTPDFDAAEVKKRKEEILNIFAPKWKVVVRRLLPMGAIQCLREMKKLI
jgi:radical SAM superfamily enzyme YgiQ (UPF0313 family)